MRYRLTPPKPPREKENDVEGACLSFLRLRHYYPIRIHCGKFWTWDKMRVLTGAPKGTPDWAFMHAIYPGFLLEAKRPGEEPSSEQYSRITEIYMGYKLEIAVIDNVDKLIAFVYDREKRFHEKWGPQ